MDQSQSELLAAFLAHMRSVAGRQMLELLVARSAALQGYAFELRMKGYLRTGRYQQEVTTPFAFIVNRSDVLFYVRKEGRAHAQANFLVTLFPDVRETSRGEIQFHQRWRQRSLGLQTGE